MTDDYCCSLPKLSHAETALPPVRGTSFGFSLPWTLRLICVLAGAWKVVHALLSKEGYEPPKCENTLCFDGALQEALLLTSVFTAGVTYASLTILFACKLPNTRCAVQQSFLNVLIDFEPTHAIHVEHGMIFTLASLVHAAAHIARVALRKENATAWATPAFRSGAAMLLCLLLIVPPMSVPLLKERVSFGVRKALHFAFLPCLVAFCFHAFTCSVVAGILLGWYVLDSSWWLLFRTYLIEHPDFAPAGGGTSVRFALPKGYTFRPGQFIYVNVPWISRTEWHPFSIIPAAPQPATTPLIHERSGVLRSRSIVSVGSDSTAEVFAAPGRSRSSDAAQHASFYAAAVGDWTQELYARSLSAVRRPIWISRSMPSPAEYSVSFDRVLLVGTGVGVTPLLSMIERYRGLKQMHLLWASRDAHMVQHFSAQVVRGVDSARIFYTGGNNEDFDWLAAQLGARGRTPMAATTPRKPPKTLPAALGPAAAAATRGPCAAYTAAVAGVEEEMAYAAAPAAGGAGALRKATVAATAAAARAAEPWSPGPSEALSSEEYPPRETGQPQEGAAPPPRSKELPREEGELPRKDGELPRDDDDLSRACGGVSCGSSSRTMVSPSRAEEEEEESTDSGGGGSAASTGEYADNAGAETKEDGASLSSQNSGNAGGGGGGGHRVDVAGSDQTAAKMAVAPVRRAARPLALPRKESVTAARWFEAEILPEDPENPCDTFSEDDDGPGSARSVRVYETRPRLGDEVRRALLSSCTGVADASWRGLPVFRSDGKLERNVESILRKSDASRLSWWAVIYCGMSAAAAGEIRDACEELGVKFRHESFAHW